MYLTLNSSFNVKLNRLRLCDGIYFSKILRRARPLPPGPAHTTPRHLSPTYPSTYPVDNIFNCFFLSFKILSLSLPPLSSTRTLLTYCILSLSLSPSICNSLFKFQPDFIVFEWTGQLGSLAWERAKRQRDFNPAPLSWVKKVDHLSSTTTTDATILYPTLTHRRRRNLTRHTFSLSHTPRHSYTYKLLHTHSLSLSWTYRDPFTSSLSLSFFHCNFNRYSDQLNGKSRSRINHWTKTSGTTF